MKDCDGKTKQEVYKAPLEDPFSHSSSTTRPSSRFFPPSARVSSSQDFSKAPNFRSFRRRDHRTQIILATVEAVYIYTLPPLGAGSFSYCSCSCFITFFLYSFGHLFLVSRRKLVGSFGNLFPIDNPRVIISRASSHSLTQDKYNLLMTMDMRSAVCPPHRTL